MRIRIFVVQGSRDVGRNLEAPGGEGKIRRELLNAGTPNRDSGNHDDGRWCLLGDYYVPGPVAGPWHGLTVQASRHPCGTGAMMTPVSQLGKPSHGD